MTSVQAAAVTSSVAVKKRKRLLVDLESQQQLQQQQQQQLALSSTHPGHGLTLAGLLERRTVSLANRSSDVWRVFGRQEEALLAIRSLQQQHSQSSSAVLSASAAPRLFSHELSGCSGAREFIVSSYAAFYRRYMALPARHRHHYGQSTTATPQPHISAQPAQPYSSLHQSCRPRPRRAD